MTVSCFVSGIRRSVYSMLAGIDRLFGCPGPHIVIFAYHSVASDTWRFSVDRELFVRQMNHLLSERKPVTLSEIQHHLTGEHLLSDPSFALCFDDGYRDILVVKDILFEKGIRPALFVLSDTEHADTRELGTNREFLTKSEIQNLQTLGWEIGCHSATHRDFWSMREEQMRRETIDAKEKLEAELGFPIRYFAYPRGRYTDTARQLVREAGYELALSMDDGVLSPKTDCFAVPRIGVDRTHSLKEFPTIYARTTIVFRKLVKQCVGRFL